MSKEDKRKLMSIPYWKNQEPHKPGTPFTDPLFPPNKNSLLGLDSNGNQIDPKAYKQHKGKINPNDIGFERASVLYGSDCKLFADKIEFGDVLQGELGDCYFLTSIGSLCEFPGLIMRLFKTKETNPDGYYELILHIDGELQIVIVDDYIPIKKYDNSAAFAQSKGNEIWVMLLEKAWAKVNGGYLNIISGLPHESLEFLTGMGSLQFNTENKNEDDLNEYKNEIVKNIKIADQNNCLISCSTSSYGNISNVGLVANHAYTLIDFIQITTSAGKNIYLFKIRNPWGYKEWNGDWSDKSKLWDSKTKSQVKFDQKEDGIFFMNDKDFFKYFTHIEICYILYDATTVTYTVEGEENLRNASVFNIETEGDGSLSVSVMRRQWRTNRKYRDKDLPTHISVCRCEPNAENHYKTFSEYNGTENSDETCTLNTKVTKGNYLIYVYRDEDHAEVPTDGKLVVKITCSAKFSHAQMPYDERDKGFPLLQNIILQAEFFENKYDPDLNEDFVIRSSNQIRGNGIGHTIYYESTPGYYIDFSGNTSNLLNYIMLSPYLDDGTTTFHRCLPAGKYLVVLGLKHRDSGSYRFSCYRTCSKSNYRMSNLEYDDIEIDLTLYTDITNNIKNEKVKERKTQSLQKAKQEFYFEGATKAPELKTFEELQKDYGDYLKLLDDVTLSQTTNTDNLQWGISKGEYVLYVGQFNGSKREGKGLLINPNNVFAGEFKNGNQNGIGITYNKDKRRLFHCNYVNGSRKGPPVLAEEEKKRLEAEREKRRQEEEKEKEERLQKQQERLKKLEEEKLAAEKEKEEEERRAEEKMQEELRQAEERQKQEQDNIWGMYNDYMEQAMRMAREMERRALEMAEEEERKMRAEQEEAKRKAEEAKRLKEEKEREAKRQEEEIRRKAEEEKRKAEERARELEEECRKAKEEAMRIKKEYEEYVKKQELEKEQLRIQREQEEKERLEREKQFYDPYRDNNNVPDYTDNEVNNKKKREKNYYIPFFNEEGTDHVCVSCGCNIF